MDGNLYSTGEFAKLCGVKKQTLFHYDDIGLLKPAHVGANGYRGYSYSQYEDFLMISCLKEAGMSLKEIASYLALSDSGAREEVLDACIESLDAKIEHLKRVRGVLATGLVRGAASQPGGPSAADEKETTLLVREARELWATPALDGLSDQQLVECVAAVVKVAEPCAIALASERVLAGDLDTQSHLLIERQALRDERLAAQLGLSPFTQPGGKYALIELYGGEDPQAVYGRLLEDMRLLHCHPGPFFYEELPGERRAEAGAPTTVAVEILLDEDMPQV